MPALLKALQRPTEASEKTALRLTGCDWSGRRCGWRGLRGGSSPPRRSPRPLPTARAPRLNLVEAARSGRRSAARAISCQRALVSRRPDRNFIRRTLEA
jgi:hypothetical protein